MGEKGKYLVLIGAGALLGSAATVAIYRLILPSLVTVYCMIPENFYTCWVLRPKCRAFLFRTDHEFLEDVNHSTVVPDLLMDEIVVRTTDKEYSVLWFGTPEKSGLFVRCSYWSRRSWQSAAHLCFLRSGVGKLLLCGFLISLRFILNLLLHVTVGCMYPKALYVIFSAQSRSSDGTCLLLYDSSSEDEILFWAACNCPIAFPLIKGGTSCCMYTEGFEGTISNRSWGKS
ncbi:hypothetical protein Sango_0253500 [Sesamum angolense]|uniref:Uncharacterized protein n=1 Tax=Sesamum angolense TaxID=2727404 RepID=A0AAE1XH68_9LAMI|nr:hypothetical protein Sango_0253500 [Sesamum angolense]